MTSARAALLATVVCAISFAGVAQGQRSLQKACTTVALTADDAGLTTLLSAFATAGLAVLAPTNEAFSEAAYSLNITLTELLASPDLTSILQNHLLAYPLDIDELLVAGTVKTQYGFQPLTIAGEMIDDTALITISSPVTSANVIKDNIIACKSFVHIIDAVLLPEM